MAKLFFAGAILVSLLGGSLVGCSSVLPASGPSAAAVHNTSPGAERIQVVDLTEPIVRKLLDHRFSVTFAEKFRLPTKSATTVGPGDVLAVSIVEAPPASLFGGESGAASSSAREVTVPEQMVSSAGTINIPFAGRVHAAGRTLRQIEEDIAERLRGKANQPQVLVRLTGNNTNYVTVLGAAAAVTHMPLTAQKERLLDALSRVGVTAEAGLSVNKLNIQITRGRDVAAMPMGDIVRDPSQNIVLQPGDIITVLHQPNSFTVLGATGRNQEVHFESPSINLAQALARSGGLSDPRANPHGVFIFRFESENALDWPRQPIFPTPDGRVRVVYCLDLSKPASFFVAQSFAVSDGDVIYTATAPAAELQKFLGIVGSIAAPASSAAAASVTVTP